MLHTVSMFRPLMLAATLAAGCLLGMGMAQGAEQETGLTQAQASPALPASEQPVDPRAGKTPPRGVIVGGQVKDRHEPLPEVFDRVDVIEHRGDRLPLGLIFTDDQGKEVTLGDYFKSGRPIILNLGYYQCPMLCDLVMNGLNQAIKDMSWVPGDQYQVISVSIDPSENHKLAASKKKTYIDDLGYDAARKGWHFLTGDQDNITMLAQAVGFRYEWVQKQMEFAHPAVIIVITPEGTISRYLYGVAYPGNTLRLSLVEASEGKVGSALDKLILTCFHFDPLAGSYALSAMKLMRLGGALTVLVVAGVIGTLLLREMARRQQSKTTQQGISASA